MTVANFGRRQRTLYSIIIITVTSIVNIILVLRLTKDSNFYSHPHKTNDIHCYDVIEGNAIPELNEYMFKSRRNIFFVETSCKGTVDPRQACAIESAARAHPGWNIHVVFTGPVTEVTLSEQGMAALQSFENVNLARIQLSKALRGTPLERVISEGLLQNSYYRVSHASDILRYYLLWKYAGIYMDMDMIVLKSLETLSRDFAGIENPYSVAAGVIGMSESEIGRAMALTCVSELGQHFEPHKWAHNGPHLITRILERLCKTSKIHLMNAGTCEGFEVYGPRVFYPIHYPKKNKLFGDHRNISFAESYTVHAWNRMSYFKKVKQNSLYARLATQYCPEMKSHYGTQLG